MKECWPDDNVPMVGGRKNTPGDYAKAICDARKMLIEEDPQWEASIRELSCDGKSLLATPTS